MMFPLGKDEDKQIHLNGLVILRAFYRTGTLDNQNLLPHKKNSTPPRPPKQPPQKNKKHPHQKKKRQKQRK